jgi:hypothetical protein
VPLTGLAQVIVVSLSSALQLILEMAKHAARPAIPATRTGYGTWFLHLAIRRSKLKSQSL